MSMKADAPVSIHDDLLYYIYDSLKWVRSFNPAKGMAPQTGVNFTGPTVIKEVGARSLHKSLCAWSLLFQQSPQVLTLTGGYTHDYGRTDGEGFYEKLEYDRDMIIEKFDILAGMCLKVANSHGQSYIMHIGL